MKRARKAAIVDSSDSENDGEEQNSDYEPDIQTKKNPPKKARVTKELKPKVKCVKEKTKPAKSKSKENNHECDFPPKGNKETKGPKAKKKSLEALNDSLYDTDPSWVPADVISRELNLDWDVTNTTCEVRVCLFVSEKILNLCQLLEAGNSLPFLARYRREATGGMGPDTLRQVKESLETLNTVKEKAVKLLGSVEKLGKLTPNVRVSILKCQSLPEIEAVSAPFKTGSKASLAERARQLGLEEAAEIVLTGSSHLSPGSLVKAGTKGRESVEEVMTGVRHIIADIIVHDPDTAELIRSLQADCHLVLEVKRAKEKASDKNKVKEADKKDVDPAKFQNYFEFSTPCKYVKPHQVLAINRGESLKILSVKINIPDWMLHQIKKQCHTRWLRSGVFSDERRKTVEDSLEDAYKRLITPLVQRQTRAGLTRMAEEASISVFLSNLRSLLLSPPHRNATVLAVDPGFAHGCKLAVLSPTGTVQDTDVIHPNFRNTKSQEASPAARRVIKLLRKHSVSTIAIGNGTACRETESLVSDIIQSQSLARVQYTIVSEQGASIYSCSSLAAEEFPGMDTNLVSAVSIGRRLQDPLSELVKIEPQHLGVGMYQHDVAKAKLKTALDEVVSECVSFVGVDVNSCSEYLLKRVAGLNSARAKAIVEYRDKNGDFVNRDQIKKVKGIGDKVWTQCAGFIRIVPRKVAAKDAKKSVKENKLDKTQIHPESYKTALQVITSVGLSSEQLGESSFCKSVTRYVQSVDLDKLADKLSVGGPTLQMIVEALQQNLEYDIRAEFSAPLFKSGLTKAENVSVGDILTGRVNNVTHFGAFVDIGIGVNGLVHVSKMRGSRVELGNRVEVRINSVELERKRIGLDLSKVI